MIARNRLLDVLKKKDSVSALWSITTWHLSRLDSETMMRVMMMVLCCALGPRLSCAVVGGYVDVGGYRYQLANSAVDVDTVDFAGDDCPSLPCTYFSVPSTCTATFGSTSIATVVESKTWSAPFLATSTGVYSVVSWLPNPTSVSVLDAVSVPGSVGMADYGWQARVLLQCAIPCPPGAILVGNGCVNCSIGTYPSTRTTCSPCTNGLPNTVFTNFGAWNNCSFVCTAGRYLTSTYSPTLLIGDTTSPGSLRSVSASGYVSTIFTASSSANPLYYMRFVTMSLDPQIVYAGMFTVSKFNLTSRTLLPVLVGSTQARGSIDGTGTGATFNSISNAALWRDEAYLVAADGGNCNIRLVNLATLQVTTVAGLALTCGFSDGIGIAARFQTMTDIVISADVAYVADSTNYRVRAVFLANQTVVTIAGTGVNADINGIGTAAAITPVYLTLSGTSTLYVKTYYGVRKINLNSFLVTTLSTSLSQSPMQMALSPSGLYLYYGGYYKVASFSIPLKTSADIAGSNVFGFADGQGVAARFRSPQAVLLLGETERPDAVCLQCTICDAGYYGVCTANTSECYQCPSNQFSNAGATACSYCAPGRYASNGVCTSCLAGTFAVPGDTACQVCGDGNYSLVGAAACAPCQAGTYSVLGVCRPCPVGAFSNAASTVCTNCSAGTFLQGVVCVNCSAGRYSLEGFTACQQCLNLPGNASYSGPGGTNSTNCDYVCNSGFSLVSADGSCSICSAGYWTSLGTAACQPCTNLPPNATYRGVGSNETNCPISCNAGYYPSRTNASLCLPCAAGTRMVAGVCVPCPSGGYSGAGSASCLPCLNGNYALGNATACTSCPHPSPYTTFIGRGTNAACSFVCNAGSYVFNRTLCVPCVAGTYAPSQGRTVCNVCTGGTWSDAGASECSPCSYLNITAAYNGTICTDYPAICKAGFAVTSVVCVP